MDNKRDKVKLIVAVVTLLAAGLILAIQFWPDSVASKQSKALTGDAAQTVRTDKTGAKEIRQGSRAWKEDAPK